MPIEQYTDQDDKRSRLTAATARGDVMLHDNFKDADGNDTDGVSGQLVFVTPEPDDPAIVAAREEQRILTAKLTDESITHSELVTLLRMERGGG